MDGQQPSATEVLVADNFPEISPLPQFAVMLMPCFINGICPTLHCRQGGQTDATLSTCKSPMHHLIYCAVACAWFNRQRLLFSLQIKEVKLCEVCQKPSNLRCSQCRQRKYCGGDCQIKDWRAGHRQACSVQQKKFDPHTDELEAVQCDRRAV